jgi:SnoaL-like polyketide cyclase
MKNLVHSIKLLAFVSIIAAMTALTSCENKDSKVLANQTTIDSLQNQIKHLTEGNVMIAKNLTTFDTLDYTVFSNQQWTRLHESHAKDIIVHMPNGSTTTGIDTHIEVLKAMFVYAPNTNIKEHPIRFGSGNYTAVTGIMTGTFTKPMPIGGGKFIQPTGKSFSLPMCTIGIWKDGTMSEEYLFWDNQTYMNQIGLGK